VTVTEPTTTAPATYEFRGSFIQLEQPEDSALVADLGFNAVNAVPLDSYLNRLDARVQAWMWMGSYTVSTHSFSQSDTTVTSRVTQVLDHPRNSHIYAIWDDTGGVLDSQAKADLCARSALIRGLDSQAKTIGYEFRYGAGGGADNYAVLASSCPQGGTVVDEIWGDGYPNRPWGYDDGRIAGQGARADALGIPYRGVVQTFQDACPANNYLYPDPATIQRMYDEWATTNQLGYVVYHWEVGCSAVWFENNSVSQATWTALN
jgi:hypothetical protein